MCASYKECKINKVEGCFTNRASFISSDFSFQTPTGQDLLRVKMQNFTLPPFEREEVKTRATPGVSRSDVDLGLQQV